ncbi:MAG: PEGA domain-containing protein [Bacteroidaceae bacterium]|nr:PEGA domain-containing protein [Bacteroidaceae bacterium]
MKKDRIIGFFIALAVSVSLKAQTAADSVKIRLETSQGAEIAIDGDISSTNLMRTKVAVGKHTVMVTYGTSYKKEYEIEVDAAHTEFEFKIDGQLTVKSKPSGGRVYIDGMERGKSPVTIDVLGTHNLRIVPSDRVSYFDYTDRITINPFQQQEQEFTFPKRPPRTYGMVLFNYMPISGSAGLGVTLACVKRWGMYARYTMSLDGASTSWGFSSGGRWSHAGGEYIYTKGPGIYKFEESCYWGVNAGFMVRTCKYVYLYAGSGYGDYTRGFKQSKDNVRSGFEYMNRSAGVMIDAGLILKWRAMLLQAGYNRVVHGTASNNSGENFGSIYLGVGFTIHKQKKDKQ